MLASGRGGARKLPRTEPMDPREDPASGFPNPYSLASAGGPWGAHGLDGRSRWRGQLRPWPSPWAGLPRPRNLGGAGAVKGSKRALSRGAASPPPAPRPPPAAMCRDSREAAALRTDWACEPVGWVAGSGVEMEAPFPTPAQHPGGICGSLSPQRCHIWLVVSPGFSHKQGRVYPESRPPALPEG